MCRFFILSLAAMGLAAVTLSSCANSTALRSKTTTAKGLKDYYKGYFPIGVAVNSHNIHGAEAKLILREFNSITPENDMKMGPIHPRQGYYRFGPTDSIAAFARTHGLKLRGHNLCWHEQTPYWLFKNAAGQVVSKDSLFARLQRHIQTVVNRYHDAVYAWDVVNEAVSDNPSALLRESPWLKICGPSFIDSAFWYAHRADPSAELYYNDYNVVFPEKAKRIYTLLKGLKDRGVPVTGIGIQAHWSVNQPTESELRSTLEMFKSLGLKIQITELDVSIFPWEKNRRQLLPKDSVVYAGATERKQAEFYKMIFKVFRDYKDVITSVTFWNVSDKDSWLNQYPVAGRKNYPLLFDRALNKKLAYRMVTEF